MCARSGTQNARLARESLLLFATVAIISLVGCDARARKHTNARIIGGEVADEEPIPYIVSLISYGAHSCGGAIVNERTVLTAAHCLAFTTARLLQVHAGTKRQSRSEGVIMPVQAIHYHQDWSMETMDYDIGVVRLQYPLIYSLTIQPIQLPNVGDVIHDGSLATVSGWGFTDIMGPTSQELRYAHVPLINQDMCYRLLLGRITDRMICAGFLRGGIDACQMDSGGPLVQQNRLIGLVSWGIGCAFPNKPGVYTRVTELLPWVNAIMAKEYNEWL